MLTFVNQIAKLATVLYKCKQLYCALAVQQPLWNIRLIVGFGLVWFVSEYNENFRLSIFQFCHLVNFFFEAHAWKVLLGTVSG